MSYVRYYGQYASLEGDNLERPFDVLELPFRIHLNFEKIFEQWEQKAAGNNKVESTHAKLVLAELDKTPQLRESITNLDELDKYADELSLLLSPLFPEMLTHNEIKAATVPMYPIFFNLSKRMQGIMDNAGEDINVALRLNDKNLLYVFACAFILNFKYNAGINMFRNLFFDAPDERTKLIRHYLVHFNADFTEFIEPEGFIPPSKEQIQELKENFEDVALWKKYFPPNAFIYKGFSLAILFDLTKHEAISALKVDLLKKDALTEPTMLSEIRNKMCSLLNIPNLRLGFASYDAEKETLYPISYKKGNSIAINKDFKEEIGEAFCDMSIHQLFEEKNNFVVSKVEEQWANESILIKNLVNQGIKSYLVMPLLYDEKLIGILELGSEVPSELTAVAGNFVKDIAPLFVTALKRTQDERETELEAIIQEQCTAIHPTVSWRFSEAAENFLFQKQNGADIDTMEDIAFENVHPLYGQSDIKGSSTERNLAIQADMVEQLTLARKIINVAMTENNLPIYSQLSHRIQKGINSISKGLNAGDEISYLEFLKKDIYPVFDHLQKINSKAKKSILEYNKKLDPELGVIYKRRKDYEQSVSLINKKIAAYLDKAQEVAQEMFPHYYERYKTDGVEHNLYIGQAMVNQKVYNPLYLQNLQLWQLMVICEVENMVKKLKTKMPLPLDVASLVLIHSNPITIKFRMEEKRFDVEGAYNIRYEIIKKRIDKAYIKGTTERLTQVGKIALVYSQEKEAKAYQQHLEYLQSINYIGSEIEWLELHDLQGVTGLKAIRVDIVYHDMDKEDTPKLSMKQIKVKAGLGKT